MVNNMDHGLPKFSLLGYDDWKIMMEAHLYALHDCMWMVLEDGPLKIQMENPERNPATPDVVQYIPKPKEKWDDRDCKKHNLDNVAKAAIFKTLDPITFSKIKHLKTAMEIWQGLGKLCEGSEDLRKQKIEVLLEKFKGFKMLPGESFDMLDERFHKILNDLASLNHVLSPKEKNVRLLRSLPKEWYTKATAMEEGRNLENYTVQGLLDELRTYEHELKKKKEEQVTPFPTALMTTPRVPTSEGTCPRSCDTPSPSQPSSSKMENYDEELAMMIKQFRKFKKFFKKADSIRRPSKGKPQVSDSPPESYLCYNCRKPGHWKSACPYPKVEKYGERERNEKKKKAMVAAESDESSSSSSDEEALVCMERRVEKSNQEDKWTMSEDDSLCLLAKDDADQEVTSQTSCSSSYESIPTSENLFDQFKKMMVDFEEINLKHSSLTEENKLLSEENLKLTEGRKSQLDEITQLKTENESLSEKVKSLNKELGILKLKEVVDKLLEMTKHKGREGLGFDPSSSKRKGRTTFIPPKPTAKPNRQKGKEKGETHRSSQKDRSFLRNSEWRTMPRYSHPPPQKLFVPPKYAYNRHRPHYAQPRQNYRSYQPWFARRKQEPAPPAHRKFYAYNYDYNPNKFRAARKIPCNFKLDEAAKYPGVWYLDSGCSRHMTGDASLLSNLIPYDGPRVTFGGSNDFGLTKGLGNLVYKELTIQAVSYVEGLNYNLLSISQFCDKGYSLEFCKDMASLKNISTNEVILTGKRIRNIYEVMWDNVKETCLISKGDTNLLWLWHKRLSHLNFKTLNKLSKEGLVEGLPKAIFRKECNTLIRPGFRGYIYHDYGKNISHSYIMEGTSRALSYTIRFIGLLGSHALGSNPRFMATAVDLGRELVRRKIRLTYGGGNVGLQGAVASTVYNNGGRVRGFIPGYIATRQVYGPTYGVEYTVSSNYYKYFKMNHIVEAFIVLPGGIDTMEGLFTLISWASEGLHSKPIGLLNIDGYFNNLIKFLDDAHDHEVLDLSEKDEEVNEGDRMKPTEFIPFRSLPLKTSRRNPDSDSAEPSGNVGQPSNIPDLSNGDNSGNGDPVPIHPEIPTTSVLQPEAELDQPVNPNQHNLRWLRDHPPQQIIGDIQSGVRTRSAQQNLEAMLACFISQVEPKNIEEALADSDILNDYWVWQKNPEDLHMEYLANTPVSDCEADDEDTAVFKPVFTRATEEQMALTSEEIAVLETTAEDFPIFPETSTAFEMVLTETIQEKAASPPQEQNQEATEEEEFQRLIQSQVFEILTTPCEISNQTQLEILEKSAAIPEQPAIPETIEQAVEVQRHSEEAEKETQMAEVEVSQTPAAIFEEQNAHEERDSLSRDISNFALNEAIGISERTLKVTDEEDVQEDAESLPLQLFKRTSSPHQVTNFHFHSSSTPTLPDEIPEIWTKKVQELIESALASQHASFRQEIELMEAKHTQLIEKSEEKHSANLKEISKSVEKTLEIISLLSKTVSNTMEIYTSDSQLQFNEFNKVKEQIANVTVGLQKQMSLLQMDIRSALAIASANQVVTKDYLKVIIDNQKEAHKLFRLIGAHTGNRKMEVILQQHNPSPIPQLPIAVNKGEASYIPSHLNITNLILEAQQRNPENSAQHLSSSGLDGTEFIGAVADHFSDATQSEERRENFKRIKELCGNIQGISEVAGSSKRKRN
ncbi:unnamed protein product [Cuscuta campestris]|uniref:cytokinin riboside 5'-monophosphate phosphoribohydrolase n=1 Tax=Cuscuta campestris TaxID=132261 RepID=A0A484LLI9_9ASTE|nr:unnamed protein product [Cuscuta campestris]